MLKETITPPEMTQTKSTSADIVKVYAACRHGELSPEEHSHIQKIALRALSEQTVYTAKSCWRMLEHAAAGNISKEALNSDDNLEY